MTKVRPEVVPENTDLVGGLQNAVNRILTDTITIPRILRRKTELTFAVENIRDFIPSRDPK